jgi:hypothetical protein
MKIRDIPFVVTEWEDLASIEHPGEAGMIAAASA